MRCCFSSRNNPSNRGHFLYPLYNCFCNRIQHNGCWNFKPSFKNFEGQKEQRIFQGVDEANMPFKGSNLNRGQGTIVKFLNLQDVGLPPSIQGIIYPCRAISLLEGLELTLDNQKPLGNSSYYYISLVFYVLIDWDINAIEWRWNFEDPAFHLCNEGGIKEPTWPILWIFDLERLDLICEICLVYADDAHLWHFSIS